MTVQELAAFNALNDFYLWGGVLLGLIISGFFKSLLNFASHRFQRPTRIKYRNMNGRHERGDDFSIYIYSGANITPLIRKTFYKKNVLKILNQLLVLIRNSLFFQSYLFAHCFIASI